MWVVPSRQAVLSLSNTFPALHTSVGQCRARDGAAQLFQPLALVRFAAHSRMQAESLMVGAERLGEHGVLRHRT